jgi:enoyl-CoA hydratase/carnithine racemase
VDRSVDADQVLEVALADAALLAALEKAYRTPEHREAVAAFLEKRAPDFSALN